MDKKRAALKACDTNQGKTIRGGFIQYNRFPVRWVITQHKFCQCASHCLGITLPGPVIRKVNEHIRWPRTRQFTIGLLGCGHNIFLKPRQTAVL
jgi:hypothetical protein